MKLITILPALLACAYAAPAPAEAAAGATDAQTGTDVELGTDAQAAADAQGATDAQLAADISEFLQVEAASPPRESIKPAVYNSILKYATYASASRQQPCNKPPFGSTVIKEFNITETSTQASLYNSSSTKEFILAIPGSDGFEDFFKTNFKIRLTTFPSLLPGCKTCRLHSGFAAAYASLLPSLTSTLRDAVKQSPDYNITLSGYSLGGALAKIAYVNLKTNSAFKDKIGNGYSYGEPRNGDQIFADYADSVTGTSETNAGNFYRTTHDGDLVPKILPPRGDYIHSSTEYFLQDPPFSRKPTLATSFRCFGQEPTDCSNGAFGDLLDHNAYPGLHDVQTCV